MDAEHRRNGITAIDDEEEDERVKITMFNFNWSTASGQILQPKQQPTAERIELQRAVANTQQSAKREGPIYLQICLSC